jgi:hypothetical protein
MPGLAHAQHNEELCDLLLANGKFDDWVITTAFYSAIHLVDHQIFPLTIASEPQFGSFSQYCNRKELGIPPHKIRRDLVTRYLPECSGAFNWLYDACHGARYNSYKVSPDIAKQAKKKLDEIKKSCKKR